MAESKQVSKDLRDKPYGGAWVIDDQNVLKSIQTFLDQNRYFDIINNTNVHEYLDNYFQYVKLSKNKLVGLDKFKSLAFSLGTTQSFDVFTLSNQNRKLVNFKGDYVYHSIIQRTQYGLTNTISHVDEIQKDYCLVISCPFADTGEEHPQMSAILDRCDELKVPVLLDMAYVNISEGINIDLQHDCIQAITTSLSKVFPLGYVRVGMRMAKQKTDDPIDMITSVDWVNKLGIGIANHLFTDYDSNYITNKYKKQQLKMCKDLDILPSKSVIFGVDCNNKFDEYNRGYDTNRLCLAKHFDTRES